MFNIGMPELAMILVVVLVVFGPGKLPEIGKAAGKAIKDFRSATTDVKDEVQKAVSLEEKPPAKDQPK